MVRPFFTIEKAAKIEKGTGERHRAKRKEREKDTEESRRKCL